MSKVKGSVNQLASDPIVSQILADCVQVPRQLDPSIDSISRRRFLKGTIGAGVAAGALSKISTESVAQVNQPTLDGETQDQLVPVVEVT